VPKHPFAELPCLLEIRPGVGGGEAALFAGDLLKMYTLLLSRLGLQTSLLKYEAADGMSDALSGSDGPLQEAILEVESPGAYALLRTEAGVHRVQRVPATESKGRVHTSVANVLVLPSIPANPNDEADSAAVGMGLMVEDPESDYYVSAADVRTDVMRARGAGGQHVNTTDSAVRLTHAPTGTVVAIQDGRSQHKNRAKAWQVLRSRLAQMRREAREEEALKLRRGLSGGGRTMGRADKVRTYNWNQGRVTDHRAGMTVHDLDGVMGGGEALEGIMEGVRGWMRDQEVEGLMAEEAQKEKDAAKEGKKK
jgi:peptide chain release factor 1